jgi:hypothetical protein
LGALSGIRSFAIWSPGQFIGFASTDSAKNVSFWKLNVAWQLELRKLLSLFFGEKSTRLFRVRGLLVVKLFPSFRMDHRARKNRQHLIKGDNLGGAQAQKEPRIYQHIRQRKGLGRASSAEYMCNDDGAVGEIATASESYITSSPP